MNLKEYILLKHSMIGGWYISSLICDKVITIFKDNKQLQSSGAVGPSSARRIDSNVKECLQLGIKPSCNDPSFIQYLKYLKVILDLYTKKYPEVKQFQKFGMVESPQIQYYKPGQGFKLWHCERTTKNQRCLVFMTFLNDVPEGGTSFKYQNLTVPAEKGLTLMWPTDFTHTHKGQITKKHEKYILTGWLGYV
jgi:prolyl 4-hydroxylase